jgi:hypothetical protein
LNTDYSWVRVGRRVRAWGSDGDFISPEGEVIHVGENHMLFMMEHPTIFGGTTDPADLVDQGWIQTRGVGGAFSINAGGGMNERQLRVLKKMIGDRSRYSNLRIEVLMDNDNVYELIDDDFDWIEYPNQIKRGIRSV